MIPRRRTSAAAVVALLVVVAGGGCALTRSRVKALADRDAPRIAFEPVIPTTITALNELPPRCGFAGNRRRSEEEFHVYEVVGTIVRVRRERDRDVHIVLEDLEHPRDRVVVEVDDPDTRRGRSSPYRERLSAARRTFADLEKQYGAGDVRGLVGQTVRVTGVGFFDVIHLQRGRSRSCIELHPVLSIGPFPRQFESVAELPMCTRRRRAGR